MAQTVTEKVMVKVKKHPREMYYEGRTTMDHMGPLVEFLNTDPKVPDPDRNREFVSTLLPGDVVGVDCETYKVTETNGETFVGENIRKKGGEFNLEPEKFTMAIGAGFAEILYRDGVPYGTNTEREVTIRVTDYTRPDDVTGGV